MTTEILDLGELQRVQLTTTLELWQRRCGHRTGTDDVLCAWAGVRATPHAGRVLDLGAGQGAVGLIVAGALPDAQVVSVEAQAVSYALLLRNIASNTLQRRFTPINGDLREVSPPDGPFDLVMGTPPFMPLGSGTPPADAQREAARFELRGGIEAYCAAASDHLAPDGQLVLVMDAARPDRYEAAIRDAGLQLCTSVAVLPGAERPPTYLVYQASRRRSRAAVTRETLTVRDQAGQWTSAFQAIRDTLNLPTHPEGLGGHAS